MDRHEHYDDERLVVCMPLDTDATLVRKLARVVAAFHSDVALRRRVAMCQCLAEGRTIPMRPVQPTRMELAVIFALAQTFDASLIDDPRFFPATAFMAERGGVALVQHVMLGARDGANTNEFLFLDALASLLEPAKPAFEFLCSTWPEVFMPQASASLQQIART